MKWSKLKSRVEAQFSVALGGRVAIYSTAYGNCSCGRAWLTLDKQIVAQFCTRAFWRRAGHQFERENDRWVTDAPVPEQVTESQKARYGLVEYGELSRQDAYQSCWEFVHDLSIEEAVFSDDVLIQSLAMLDRRLGKRRLMSIEAGALHALAQKMRTARMEAEGMVVSV